MASIRNDILELASKLNEGDYLKIANILKDTVEPTTKSIYRVKYLKPCMDYENEFFVLNYIKKERLMELTHENYEGIVKCNVLGSYKDKRYIGRMFVPDESCLSRSVRYNIKMEFYNGDEPTEIQDGALFVQYPVISIEKI